jgi:hypothetical protein
MIIDANKYLSVNEFMFLYKYNSRQRAWQIIKQHKIPTKNFKGLTLIPVECIPLKIIKRSGSDAE